MHLYQFPVLYDDIRSKLQNCEDLSLEISLNCLFLDNKIRDSFLIQILLNIDNYIEINIKIIDTIQKYFNNFKFIYINQGVLVTKNNTIIPFQLDNYTDRELGDFLGYPCSGDINDNRNYSFSIYGVYNNRHEQIYGMISKDNNNPILNNFIVKIVNFINKLNGHIDNQIILDIKFKKLYNLDDVINCVINNNICDDIQNEIVNLLYNHNFQLLVRYHNNKLIDMFNKDFSEILYFILIICKTEQLYPLDYKILPKFVYNNDIMKKNKLISETIFNKFGIYFNDN